MTKLTEHILLLLFWTIAISIIICKVSVWAFIGLFLWTFADRWERNLMQRNKASKTSIVDKELSELRKMLNKEKQ
jgi:hypothetical protein